MNHKILKLIKVNMDSPLQDICTGKDRIPFDHELMPTIDK